MTCSHQGFGTALADPEDASHDSQSLGSISDIDDLVGMLYGVLLETRLS